MFPNLRAEMARENIKPANISSTLDITYDSVINKLNGKTDFTRAEIFKIRDVFFPDLTLDYLFKNKERSA